MPALAARVLVASCLLTLGVAQDERRPESFQVALGLQQRGLHDEAAKYLRSFLADHAGHALAAEANYRLAQSELALQHPEPAQAALQQAVQRGGAKFPLRAEALYRLGTLLHERGDHDGAAQQLGTLCAELPPQHYLAAAARYALGEAQRERGDDEAAAAAFAATAGLAKGEAQAFGFPALYQLGFAELRRGRLAQAATAFAAAREAAGDDAARDECSYLLGDTLLRREDWGGAAKALTAAAEGGGEFADDAAYALGWVALGRGDKPAALEAFARLLAGHPQSPFADEARLERARCRYQLDDAKGAAAELRPLLADGHPLQQKARELAGLCALATGEGQAAVAQLQQALTSVAAADKPRLQFALGEALSNLERFEDALAAYAQVPDDAPAELRGDAAYGRCHALHRLGRFEASIAAAEQVLEIAPPHRSAVLAQLAVAEDLFALQRYADAAKRYEPLLQQAAHRRAARWKLAWCRYLLGDKAAAAQSFAAIAKDQDDGDREEALSMQALAAFEAGDQDDALQACDRYLARHAEGRFLDRTERIAARVLRQRGDLAAAQKRLQRAARVTTGRDGAEAASRDVAEQAELAYQQGDFAGADKLFAQLVALPDATGVRALAGRAWCAFELGDDEACRSALAAAQAHPAAEEERAGLLELASAVAHRGARWADAIAAGRAFLQRFGEHEKAPQLRYALGVALARSGDQKGARAEFERLLRDGAHPDRDRVAYELAWACRRGGDEAAALRAFAEVAQATEDVELGGEARLFLGTSALAKTPPDLAAATAALAAVKGSLQQQALYRLGFGELEAADAAADAGARRELLQRARQHFDATAQLTGDELRGEAWFFGAECCRQLEDAEGAVARCQQLLKGAPQHGRAMRARLLLGECALIAGQPEVAVAPLEQFLRQPVIGDAEGHEEPAARADRARANLWLGRARLARREHEAAERCFVTVTELSDGALAAEAQLRLGESRRQRGDLNGAVDAFVKLPILYAEPTWARQGLLQAGELYLQLRQPDKARVLFTELVERHQGSAEAKAAAEHLNNR
ncbi:MAG: tetratricopeptide repeat protein [Planctomycetes bacterium]|nr:tetratricopeptide repeat protein [Planctomycetota bacterium]